MYLINPAGIIFGEHANLDIQGSFHASTADYLRLGKNGRFDARHPKNSLLTVAPPSAFGFLDQSPAGIEKYGFLTVGNGKTLSLIGGDLTLQDSNLTKRDNAVLSAPGGQVNLVSVASSGEVPVDPEDIHDNAFEQFGTIRIIDKPIKHDFTRQANIYVSGEEGGGKVYIKGGKITMKNVDIQAENIKGVKKGQGIIIKAKEIHLTGSAKIITSTDSSGAAGDINLI
jgi:large exoprotein involved in heme utilization and adhesion